MRAKLEVLAMVLGFIGLVGTVTITALPMWRVTAFIGANLIVMETLWEGLWMNCYRHANIRMQCKVYDSLLILPKDLQAARGLICLSIALAFFALLIAGCGIRGTNCCRDNPKAKNIALAVGGCLYLLSCLTTLVPVSWTAHIIINNFYSPHLEDPQKRELGEALYIGWVTAALLLIAGVTLLYRFAHRRSKEPPHTETLVMTEKDKMKEDTDTSMDRQTSSFYKHSQYV